jgi:hypothetical protein
VACPATSALAAAWSSVAGSAQAKSVARQAGRHTGKARLIIGRLPFEWDVAGA